jgi:hypothetical protein
MHFQVPLWSCEQMNTQEFILVQAPEVEVIALRTVLGLVLKRVWQRVFCLKGRSPFICSPGFP